MGREFLDIFEQWAHSYDESLISNREYEEVFRDYEMILQEVVNRSNGYIVEFGSGTGNLTIKMINKGLNVTAFEPSPSMRSLALNKIGEKAEIEDGDFLHFSLKNTPNTFVSTYAFHHLTDKEKEEAIRLYSNYLPIGGKIVFADTMFQTQEHYKLAINDAINKQFYNLAEDLQREYYPTISVLNKMLENNGFQTTFKQYNQFVWILEGIKA